MQLRVATIFKTHFWDDFVQRQFERLKASAQGTDIFVVFDATISPAPDIPHDRIEFVTEREMVARGFADASTDTSLFWYNIDYPHYVIFSNHTNYDYYVTIEYDVGLNVELNVLIDGVVGRDIDYLGFPLRHTVEEWPWFDSHMGVYKRDDIVVYLSCFAIFSNRAMRLLYERRLEMSRAFKAGTLEFWPNNEAFIPTEIKAAGFVLASISDFAMTKDYDWWPPTYESDATCNHSIVHPVLEGDRYIRSILRHEPRLLSYFKSSSVLNRKLSRFPRTLTASRVRQEFRRRALAKLDRELARIGVRRPWTAGAKSRSPNVAKRSIDADPR